MEVTITGPLAYAINVAIACIILVVAYHLKRRAAIRKERLSNAQIVITRIVTIEGSNWQESGPVYRVRLAKLDGTDFGVHSLRPPPHARNHVAVNSLVAFRHDAELLEPDWAATTEGAYPQLGYRET